MGFQLCPACKGNGQDCTVQVSSGDRPCPVCGGMRIISELTGKPPKHDGDKCPYDPSKIKFC